MPKRGKGSTTQKTERAGAAAVAYNRLEEIEATPIGAAHIKDVFAGTDIDKRTWRMMSLSEQLAGLRHIERRLEQPEKWFVTEDGYACRVHYTFQEGEEAYERALLRVEKSPEDWAAIAAWQERKKERATA